MCLIVTREKGGKWLPNIDEQSNAWNSNPHGFGLAYVKGGRFVVSKTMNERDVPGMFERVPNGAPFVAHWRLATDGPRVISNCHPWPCLGGRWVGAHNGVLSRQPLIEGLTDSESYLRTLKGTEPNIPKVEKDIERLGYGKIAFLSTKGEIRIANEAQGEWREDTVWQSNGGLDAVPWYAYGMSKVYSSFRSAIICDSCLSHEPLFRDGSSMLCQDCLEGGAQWMR